MPLYTMVAVYSSSMEQNRFSGFEKPALEKQEKSILSWVGHGTQIDIRMYTTLLHVHV